MTDPIAAIVTYLRGLPELSSVRVTGDMNTREVGETTVYVEPTGGFRVLRDCEDRIDISYEVYAAERQDAVQLAFDLRELLFRLRDVEAGGLYFLDCYELSMPDYEPDPASREHVYSGEVACYYTAA